MKKSVALLTIFLVGVFLISFASAGWFSDFVGKITGKVTSSSDGMVFYSGDKIDLNGTTYKDVSVEGLPYGASAKSLCAFASTSSISSGWNWIFSFGSSLTSSAFFIGRNGDDLYGGGFANDVYLLDFWKVNQTNHICLTYDGTNARLYANGVLVSSYKKSWNVIKKDARIGSQVGGSPFNQEMWEGTVSDIRVYNRVLSEAEIKQLANPQINCTSFTYSNWSSCTNGQQTRTITSFSPSGCTGGIQEALSQSCTVTPVNSLRNGLVGYWPLDETSGTTSKDYSGNGNNGALYSDTFVSGKVGGGLKNNYWGRVEVAPNSSLMVFDKDFSICGWIKSTSSWEQAMFSFNAFRVEGSGKFGIFGQCSSGYGRDNSFFVDFWGDSLSFSLKSNKKVCDDSWHYVCSLVNGNNLRLYIDGGYDSSLSLSGARTNSNSKLVFGSDRSGGGTGRYLSGGILDEMAVWNRALSDSEISRLYNSGNGLNNLETSVINSTNITIPTCTSFTYSNWSACTNGQQTRTVLTSSPSGCTGGIKEALSQNCTAPRCTYFRYSDWSVCNNGQQTRTVLASSPEGCVIDGQVLSQICGITPNCTSFTYSNWSACTNGQQTRTVLTSSPSGCTGGIKEALSQNCTNVSSACQNLIENNGLLFEEIGGYKLGEVTNAITHDSTQILNNSNLSENLTSVSHSYLYYFNGTGTNSDSLLIIDHISLFPSEQNFVDAEGFKFFLNRTFWDLDSVEDEQYYTFHTSGNTSLVSFLAYPYKNNLFIFSLYSNNSNVNKGITSDSLKQYLLSCPSQINLECSPRWVKSYGFSVCPSNGKNSILWHDSNDCEKDITKEINCTSGDCNGCSSNGKCYPVGYRLETQYCDFEGVLEQKDNSDSCINNFECTSNICINKKCISSGIWEKFLEWFKSLFGGVQ
jgi:hypothetical protein